MYSVIIDVITARIINNFSYHRLRPDIKIDSMQKIEMD